VLSVELAEWALGDVDVPRAPRYSLDEEFNEGVRRLPIFTNYVVQCAGQGKPRKRRKRTIAPKRCKHKTPAEGNIQFCKTHEYQAPAWTPRPPAQHAPPLLNKICVAAAQLEQFDVLQWALGRGAEWNPLAIDHLDCFYRGCECEAVWHGVALLAGPDAALDTVSDLAAGADRIAANASGRRRIFLGEHTLHILYGASKKLHRPAFGSNPLWQDTILDSVSVLTVPGNDGTLTKVFVWDPRGEAHITGPVTTVFELWSTFAKLVAYKEAAFHIW